MALDYHWPPQVNFVCYSCSFLTGARLQFSTCDRFYATKANVFSPYHIKVFVLPFFPHWLQLILMADFVNCCYDPLV